MRDKKYYIALDDFERRVVINCLNEMRNSLIANGKYTDAVDVNVTAKKAFTDDVAAIPALQIPTAAPEPVPQVK